MSGPLATPGSVWAAPPTISQGDSKLRRSLGPRLIQSELQEMPLATGVCFPRTEFASSACEEPTTQLREGVKRGIRKTGDVREIQRLVSPSPTWGSQIEITAPTRTSRVSDVSALTPAVSEKPKKQGD